MKLANNTVDIDSVGKINCCYIDGFMDYNHAGIAQSYISGSLKLLNDGAGAQTLKTYKPYGITELWNVATNQFNFSELAIGDEVSIRLSLDVTTSGVNQEFSLSINFAIGGGTYHIHDGNFFFKTAGTKAICSIITVYIGNADTKNLPAELLFTSDANATVQVNGFYISTKRRPY